MLQIDWGTSGISIYFAGRYSRHYAFWLSTCLLRLLMECIAVPLCLLCCLRPRRRKRWLFFISLLLNTLHYSTVLIRGQREVVVYQFRWTQNKTNTKIKSNKLVICGKACFRQNVNMHHVWFEVPRLRLIPDGFPQTLAVLTQWTCLSINVALKQLHTYTHNSTVILHKKLTAYNQSWSIVYAINTQMNVFVG